VDLAETTIGQHFHQTDNDKQDHGVKAVFTGLFGNATPGIRMNTVDAQLQKAITRLKEMISRAEID
jgi:hypothetical protein